MFEFSVTGGDRFGPAELLRGITGSSELLPQKREQRDCCDEIGDCDCDLEQEKLDIICVTQSTMARCDAP